MYYALVMMNTKKKKKKKRKGKETKHIYIAPTHTHQYTFPVFTKKLMKAEMRQNNRLLILFIFPSNKYLPLQWYTKLKKKGDKRGV